MPSSIPNTGTSSTLASSISKFLKDHPTLHLGGANDFHQERRHHLEVFGFHALPKDKQAPIGKVEFHGVRGPHGSIPIRVFYPKAVVNGENAKSKGGTNGETTKSKGLAALVYMHGGGYTVGSVDEFENGLRLVTEAQSSYCIIRQTIGVEYHLAPEHHFPTQLDEYSAVVDWAQGPEGAARGISSDLVFGGGDSAGGNMTEALALRRRDQGKKNIAGQSPGFPSTPWPPKRTTPAPEKTYPPSFKYVSPGMQSVEYLKNQPPVALFTCGFDPLRDVGVEYGSKLQQAGVDVQWHHYPDLTHGFLQMAPWSHEALKATEDVARELKRMVYGC
ncbi:hypothetical protein ABEF95_008736 [Exophiala dermatitidis]